MIQTNDQPEMSAEWHCETIWVMGVARGCADLVLDTGKENNAVGKKDVHLLRNIGEDDVLIKTVTRQHELC